MTDSKELIVRFKQGVPENIARAAATSAGATVRRRMRTDFPNEVMLLVRADASSLAAVEAKLKAYPSVLTTEPNGEGFGVR